MYQELIRTTAGTDESYFSLVFFLIRHPQKDLTCLHKGKFEHWLRRKSAACLLKFYCSRASFTAAKNISSLWHFLRLAPHIEALPYLLQSHHSSKNIPTKKVKQHHPISIKCRFAATRLCNTAIWWSTIKLNADQTC